MSSGTSQLFDFGQFRADGLRRILSREGQPVPLTSKAFDTLLVLIENRDRVVSKDELLKTIWPDSFVEEANLAQNVSALRRALGESPGEHRFIATVPGRGYRFVAEVHPLIFAASEMTLQRTTTAEVVVEELLPKRMVVAGATILLLIAVATAGWRAWSSRATDVTAMRSIAVLPFQSLLPASENPLGLGLADAVITKLSNIHQLVVRPTTSILQYAGTSADPRAAGRELDVEALLEGTLQQSGDRLRVTVQLVRASDQRPMWAETFDAGFTDIFAIEDTISEKVAQALAVKLAQGEKQRVDRRYTANLEAYRNYLNGRFAEFQFTGDGLQHAIAYFDKAIAIDPRYALAYAGLADAYTTASDWVLSPREAMPKAEAAARQALAYDDGLAEAYSALAHAELHEWKLDAAGKDFARSLALNSNLTSTYFAYGEYLAAAGQQDRAVAEFQKALSIDPLSAEIQMMSAFPLYLKHDFPAAEAADTVAIRTHPNFWPSYMGRGYAYLAEKRYSEAIADFEKGRELNPYATINLSGLAAAQALAGNRAGALKFLDQIKSLMSTQHVAPFDIAVVYMALGDHSQALAWLERAYADQSEMLLFLDFYPPWANLQSEPRFQDLVRRVRASDRT